MLVGWFAFQTYQLYNHISARTESNHPLLRQCQAWVWQSLFWRCLEQAIEKIEFNSIGSMVIHATKFEFWLYNVHFNAFHDSFTLFVLSSGQWMPRGLRCWSLATEGFSFTLKSSQSGVLACKNSGGAALGSLPACRVRQQVACNGSIEIIRSGTSACACW